MKRRESAPGSALAWLRHARSDLAVAQARGLIGVLLETLCYHAQQAAEKSIKAVLVSRGIPPPKTHNLRVLLSLLPQDISVPPRITGAAALSNYAVEARYPDAYEPVTEGEYREAVELAAMVLQWAEAIGREGRSSSNP